MNGQHKQKRSCPVKLLQQSSGSSSADGGGAADICWSTRLVAGAHSRQGPLTQMRFASAVKAPSCPATDGLPIRVRLAAPPSRLQAAPAVSAASTPRPSAMQN
ncbi:unnamed protein product [Sphagnum balticum]